VQITINIEQQPPPIWFVLNCPYQVSGIRYQVSQEEGEEEGESKKRAAW